MPDGDMLPINLPLAQMQTKWKSEIDPVLINPLNSVNFINGVTLASGVTTINHKLGRMMQGWFITDINGSATIYRSQPLNNITLTLTSSATVTVNIGVF